MASLREATVQFHTDLRFIEAVLVFSAIFVFFDISGHEDKYFSQKYALAMLLYDLSLLISSELISRPSIGKMGKWRFILQDTMGLYYYLFIPVCLIGASVYQTYELFNEYEISPGRWSAFKLFVIILTAFTTVVRISRAVDYVKQTGETFAAPDECNKSIETVTICKESIKPVMLPSTVSQEV